MQSNCTKSEIEHLARDRFHYPARVFSFNVRLDGVDSQWYGLELLKSAGAKQIVGCRRELAELVPLIERGSAMECLANAKVRPFASGNQNRVLEDSTRMVRS
jgi:hypothetical protein